MIFNMSTKKNISRNVFEKFYPRGGPLPKIGQNNLILMFVESLTGRSWQELSLGCEWRWVSLFVCSLLVYFFVCLSIRLFDYERFKYERLHQRSVKEIKRNEIKCQLDIPLFRLWKSRLSENLIFPIVLSTISHRCTRWGQRAAKGNSGQGQVSRGG